MQFGFIENKKNQKKLEKLKFAHNLDVLNLNKDFLIENFCVIFFIDKRTLHFTSTIENSRELSELSAQLSFLTGLKAKYFPKKTQEIEELIEKFRQEKNLSILKDPKEDLLEIDLNESFLSDAPVVQFINTILEIGINSLASDIHFEPYETDFRIRLRLDGVLKEIKTMTLTTSEKIISRLKIMAKLDISEKRLPQDGNIKITIKDEDWDIRVNSLPTIYGEKIVLRILDKRQSQISIKNLGFLPDQEIAYLNALEKPQGMILITGPTGSGKTLSLYTGLGILNTEDKNITTAEDPVEIKLDGINQVMIQPKIGLDFSECLRAFLRQDPDVIMVGEIRDLETAEISIKAAQTGHLVLSTLHTNSAIDTIVRLINIGIAKYNLADSLVLVGAQRLIRKLCNFCKIKNELSEIQLRAEGFYEIEDYLKNLLQIENLSELQIYKASKGCDKCNQGYKGRTGIFEILSLDNKLKNLLLADADLAEVSAYAQTLIGMNLQKSGLCKVAQGQSSLEELRVAVMT